MMLLSFVLSFIGFILICLSMRRHLKQLRPQSRPQKKRQILTLRFTGFITLALAGALCMTSQGVAIGLVYWVGLLTFVALLNTLLLAFGSSWVRSLSVMQSRLITEKKN